MNQTFVIKSESFDKLMEEKHFSMRDLAKRMNVNASTVYRLRNGENSISGTSMVKMLTAFDLTPDQISVLFSYGRVLHKRNMGAKR